MRFWEAIGDLVNVCKRFFNKFWRSIYIICKKKSKKFGKYMPMLHFLKDRSWLHNIFFVASLTLRWSMYFSCKKSEIIVLWLAMFLLAATTTQWEGWSVKLTPWKFVQKISLLVGTISIFGGFYLYTLLGSLCHLMMISFSFFSFFFLSWLCELCFLMGFLIAWN